jgi:tetratricopeptide (TPR) repeat protein
LDEKNTLALAYKGLSLGELGNISIAIKYFTKALSIDCDYDLAQSSLETAKKFMHSN